MTDYSQEIDLHGQWSRALQQFATAQLEDIFEEKVRDSQTGIITRLNLGDYRLVERDRCFGGKWYRLMRKVGDRYIDQESEVWENDQLEHSNGPEPHTGRLREIFAYIQLRTTGKEVVHYEAKNIHIN